MQLNSFVVKVTKYDYEIHHHAPTDLDTAKKKYEDYISKYFVSGPPSHIFCLGEYSNKFLVDQVKKWRGDPSVAWRLATTFIFESSQQAIKIRLAHISRN